MPLCSTAAPMASNRPCSLLALQHPPSPPPKDECLSQAAVPRMKHAESGSHVGSPEDRRLVMVMHVGPTCALRWHVHGPGGDSCNSCLSQVDIICSLLIAVLPSAFIVHQDKDLIHTPSPALCHVHVSILPCSDMPDHSVRKAVCLRGTLDCGRGVLHSLPVRRAPQPSPLK